MSVRLFTSYIYIVLHFPLTIRLGVTCKKEIGYPHQKTFSILSVLTIEIKLNIFIFF